MMRNGGSSGSEDGAKEDARGRSPAPSASSSCTGMGWRLYFGDRADVQGPSGGVGTGIFAVEDLNSMGVE